jgi:2-polyprenyl-3-methyl-5-hydroxy-6-metoxy-1,4-benzoquinol methylase
MATAPPQVSPTLFFKTINAYQETEALRAAIQLDVFTAIDEGAHDPAAIAARCHASERGIRILCDYLTILGFLVKDGRAYRLTPDTAAFLSRKSPTNITAAVGFLHEFMLTQRFSNLADVVRKGGTLEEKGTMAPDHPIWVEFAHSMASMSVMPAQTIAQVLNAGERDPWKVLDIAAGHGMYGIMLARANPNAEIYAVDWTKVLEVAQANAIKAGVKPRYHTLPGSAFEVEFGSDYDIVLLTNFLHHFSPETNDKLLRKVHAALKPGGRAVTLEFVPNEDRITPAGAAAFSLMMLGSTEEGDAYTFAELDKMFRNAGFASNDRYALPGELQTVVISHKARN